MGSASELEYFLLLARDLNYLPSETYDLIAQDLCDTRRMLNCLMSKVQSECTKTSKRSSANC